MAGFMVLSIEYLSASEIPCCDCSCHKSSDGWYARYSAPGYLDTTDYVGPFISPIDAAKACFEAFGDDSTNSDDRRELAAFLWSARKAGHRQAKVSHG